MTDEWETVAKPTRRRRPQRRRHNQHYSTEEKPTAAPCGHNHGNQNNATAFFQNAVAAQLRTTLNDDSATQEQIEIALELCLAELRSSRYYERLGEILNQHTFGSIVCYGIGNFGTKRPSAPMWQLALAILLQEHTDSAKMHYFEPLMTPEESKVLQKLQIHVIEENERGKRSLANDNDSMTLFFMPHCPLSLYTNLFHTNWGDLRRVVVFGNSLNNYIDGANTNIVTDPQKKQALTILETLQPHWTIHTPRMDKKDIADLSAYFEQAFNDSSLTSFVQKEDGSWPERPHLDTPTEYDGGEVL